MSAKSRGRHRFAQPAEREVAAEQQKSKLGELMEAFEGANTKAGLRKLVGLVLKDREEELAANPVPELDPEGPRLDLTPRGLREPTQYERAVLSGLGRLPHMYGGTVEPWRVERRRRRNKAARSARRAQRKAAAR